MSDDNLAAAQEMQDEIAKTEESMGSFIAQGKSENGLVQVEMNGYHEIQQISINDELKNINKELLAEALKEALNEAIDQVGNELETRMSSIVYKYAVDFGEKGE